MKRVNVFNIVFLCIVIALCAYFVWYPLFREHYKNLLPLLGYRPLWVHSRDNALLLTGIVGCVLVLCKHRWGWFFVNFFSVSWLSLSAVECFFGLEAYDTFYQFDLYAIALLYLTNSKRGSSELSIIPPKHSKRYLKGLAAAIVIPYTIVELRWFVPFFVKFFMNNQM